MGDIPAQTRGPLWSIDARRENMMALWAVWHIYDFDVVSLRETFRSFWFCQGRQTMETKVDLTHLPQKHRESLWTQRIPANRSTPRQCSACQGPARVISFVPGKLRVKRTQIVKREKTAHCCWFKCVHICITMYVYSHIICKYSNISPSWN